MGRLLLLPKNGFIFAISLKRGKEKNFGERG